MEIPMGIIRDSVKGINRDMRLLGTVLYNKGRNRDVLRDMTKDLKLEGSKELLMGIIRDILLD